MQTPCNRLGRSPTTLAVLSRHSIRKTTSFNTAERVRTASSHGFSRTRNEHVAISHEMVVGPPRPLTTVTGGTSLESNKAKVFKQEGDKLFMQKQLYATNACALSARDRLNPRNSKDPDSNSIPWWENLFLDMRQTDQDVGVWNSFLYLQQVGKSWLLTEPSAGYLRLLILESALHLRDRIPQLLRYVEELKAVHGYTWDNLYTEGMHILLDHEDYHNARYWHFRLYPVFTPSPRNFGLLLSSFIIKPSPEMQRVLNTIYIFSRERSMYDFIIPTLFQNGQSNLARVWRKKLLSQNDSPSAKTFKSRPFIGYLSCFFPLTPLSKTEMMIAKSFAEPQGTVNDSPRDVPGSNTPSQKGLLSDSTVARWFASSWASLEFTINLLGKVGLGEVGPLALQSIVLREDNLSGIQDRFDQLSYIDVPISRTTYCDLVVSFTKRGDLKLLRTLLQCDVHPDEFGDIETRKMLLAEALRKGDREMESLFRAIEHTLQSRLSPTLSDVLQAETQSSYTKLSDRPVQPQQLTTLQSAFRTISIHPSTGTRSPEWEVDEAIEAVRLDASQDRAVPLGYWRVMIKVLGRSERFQELEQICSEIVDIYHPRYGGIIPIHSKDWPPTTKNNYGNVSERKTTSALTEHHGFDEVRTSQQDWQRDRLLEKVSPEITSKILKQSVDAEPMYIPSDLSFHHQQHPLRKLFTPKLQRSIVRWGFSNAVKYKPTAVNVTAKSEAKMYDLAQGVRLLAILRDKGVFIDEQALKSGLRARLALSRTPRRTKDRARDSNEMRISSLKVLVDQAWGSELLPPLTVLLEELENEAVKQRNNDSRLMRTILIPRKDRERDS